jgi:predicted short-subunit dehydrogenase-like oxidoreductase (DUF2520 family)
VSRDDRPLASLRFALVGPGRVGESLAHWLVALGADCVAVAGRLGSAPARETARRLGAPATTSADFESAPAHLTLIAVPDGALPEVARHLAGRVHGVALHVSGALGASVLAPIQAAGSAIGTFHPLRAFPAVETDPERGRGIFYALDGDPEARALGRRLAEALGGRAAVVPEPVRVLYHLAASIAAGGVATVVASANALARAAGVPDAALSGYGELARGALEAALAAPDPATAITGPAARGDLEAVERQLAALDEVAPEFRALVVALAREALARSAERTPPTAAQKALAQRLSKPEVLDRSKDRVLVSRSPV